MRFASFSALLLSVSLGMAAEPVDTAYSALRVVGKQKGQALLNQVVELRGRNGTPQPAVWKIVIREAGARGGLREIEVQRGQIIAERTPTVVGSVGEAMDLSHLNLDSDGLFTVVNQESRQQAQPFDRVDYVLRSGSGGGAPVWTADLFEARNGKVATFQVAADSGSILAQTRTRGPAGGDPSSDREFLNGNRGPDSVDGGGDSRLADDGEHSKPGQKFRGVGDFFHRLGKRVERRGQELENFFTGKSER